MNPVRFAAMLGLLVVVGCASGRAQQAPSDPTGTPMATVGLHQELAPAEGGIRTRGTGWGQVTMVNKTSMTLDLYVDGGYGCRALKGLMCTTHVRAGTHTLVAKTSDGRSVSTSVTLNSGDSFTWTITED